MECVRRWELRDFKGSPPEPRIVAMESEEQNEVVTMVNLARFRERKANQRRNSKRGFNLEDI